MDYSKALSFTFADESWLKKIALGGLFNFIAFFTGIFFFIGFFAIGYTVEVIRNVLRDKEKPLPEWNDMGKKFVDGLLVAIICFVYLIVIGGLGALWIVYVATSEQFSGGTEAFLIVLGSLAIAAALAIFVAAGVIQYATSDNFGKAFNLQEIFELIGYDFGHFIAILLFVAILQFFLFLVGLGILSPFTTFWGMVVEAHLLGQYAKEALAQSVGELKEVAAQ